MKRTYLWVLIPWILVLMVGCGDEETNYITNMNEEGYTDGRVIGTLHGVVTDGDDNALLPGVTVWTAINGRIVSTRTNSRGYYALSGLHEGDYQVTYDYPESDKAVNYATSMAFVTIPDLVALSMDTIPHSVNFPHSETMNMDLWPMNAALSGRVFKQVDDETAQPAIGVTVIADFGPGGWNLSVDQYTTVSDSNGNYEFPGLPGTPSVNIRNLPFSDDTYEFGVDLVVGAGLVPGGSVYADPLLVNRAGIAPVILSDNFRLGGVGVDESLVLTFSEAMDTSRSSFQLWRAGNPVPVSVTWTDNTTATVDPYATLRAGANYTLNLDAWTLGGVNWLPAYSFNTIMGIDVIYTNLETADGVFTGFPIDQDITLLFTVAPDLENLNTSIVLSRDGGLDPLVYTNITQDGALLTLSTINDLSPGTAYDLDYTVHSAYTGDATSGHFDFTTAAVIASPPVVTGFVFDNPALAYDYDSMIFNFDWDVAAGVDGYSIYAYNTLGKSEKILVQNYAGALINTGTANLSLFTEVFGADALIDGRTVYFQIAAYNDAGFGPLSAALSVSDEIPPVVAFGVPSASADNTAGGTPTEVTITLSANEPLDTATMPTFNITNGGVPYVLLQSALSFEFNGNRMGGVLTLTVPAGVDASGDVLELNVCKDSSGNGQTTDDTVVLW